MAFTVEFDAHTVFFTEVGAPVRETGWTDSYSLDRETREFVFFDAEANRLYPASPIGALRVEVWEVEDQLDADRREF